jgi:hypothetical protein
LIWTRRGKIGAPKICHERPMNTENFSCNILGSNTNRILSASFHSIDKLEHFFVVTNLFHYFRTLTCTGSY